MDCANLATKAELEQLRQELRNKFIPKEDRQPIIQASVGLAVPIVIGALDPRIAANAARIAANASKLAAQAGQIAANAARIAGAVAQLAQVLASIAAVLGVAATIRILGNRLDRLDGRITSLESLATSLQGRIFSNARNIDQNAGAISGLRNRVLQAIDEADLALERAGQALSKVVQLDRVVRGNSSNIQSNESAISRNSSAIGAIEDQIGNLQTRIRGAVATAERALNSATAALSRIGTLEGLIESLRGSVSRVASTATQALTQARQAAGTAQRALTRALQQPLVGPQGPPGIIGPQGVAGPKGETGARGFTGERGARGRDGIDADENAILQRLTALLQPQLAEIQNLIQLGNTATATGLGTLLESTRVITSQTAPAAISTAAEQGVCNSTRPGGCLGNPLNSLRNNQNQILNQLNLLGTGINNAVLNAINTTTTRTLQIAQTVNAKLGAAIPGGLSGFLQSAWNTLNVDKALAVVNNLLLVHNAARLSTDLARTLGDLSSQALSTFGIQDANGNPIDVNEAIGQSIENSIRSVIGDAAFNGVSDFWNRTNRIVTSGANIVNSVRSISDSTQQIAEWTAENTGKIGNALKRWRVVGENAYEWMPERVDATSAARQRFERVREGLENLEEAASSISGVLAEVQSIQEEFNEWDRKQNEFELAIREALPNSRENNAPVLQKRQAEQADSQASPEVATDGLFKNEE